MGMRRKPEPSKILALAVCLAALLVVGFLWFADHYTVTYSYEEIRDHLFVVEDENTVRIELRDFYAAPNIAGARTREEAYPTHRPDLQAGICYHYMDRPITVTVSLWDSWFMEKEAVCTPHITVFRRDGSRPTVESGGICVAENGEKLKVVGTFVSRLYYADADGTKHLLYTFHEPAEPW